MRSPFRKTTPLRLDLWGDWAARREAVQLTMTKQELQRAMTAVLRAGDFDTYRVLQSQLYVLLRDGKP